jgi:hypothetical protein
VGDPDSVKDISFRPRGQPGDSIQNPAGQAMKDLDQACLDVSITLLDHDTRDDLYGSPVVAFMAVLGVDSKTMPCRLAVVKGMSQYNPFV